MRRIELKVYTIENSQTRAAKIDPPPTMTTAEGISQIVETKREGMALAELRQCLRIQDAVARAKDSVLLEDADWSYLNARLAQHLFPFACEAFDRLACAIEGAEPVDPNAPGAAKEAA